MLIIFPMLLIWILGTALSGVFGNEIKLDQLTVLYTNQAKTPLGEAFASFVSTGKQLGMKFVPVKTSLVAINRLKKSQASCYLKVNANGERGSIEFYQNHGAEFEANIVKAALEPFLERYNAILTISQLNPQVLPEVLQTASKDYVQLKTVSQSRQPSSMDYYAVVMLTLMLLYAGFLGVTTIHTDKVSKTINRLLVSPISIFQLMSGKALGCLMITMLQAVVLILFSKYFLNTYWGTNLAVVLLLIISEVLMVVSLGLGIGLFSQNEAVATVILQMLIPVLGFLGGSYFSLEGFPESFLKIAEISPLRWLNQTLFEVIYRQDLTNVPVTIMINLGLAMLFTLTVVYFVRQGRLQR